MNMRFKETIKLIIKDGWYIVRQSGSQKQYHHKQKKGTVTIAGKPGDDIHPKTLRSILIQAQINKL